mgnify:CR=1 FL=1
MTVLEHGSINMDTEKGAPIKNQLSKITEADEDIVTESSKVYK